MLDLIKRKPIYFLLSFYFLASLIILFTTNGTGENGSGDSILHYLYAKYAITNSSLFFNHWAKPFFVFLSFPFAQFGIVGMKFFNIIVSLFTLLFTYKTAVNLNYKNSILGAIILLCTPLFFVLTFSGLTEPLFALFTIISVYLFGNQKYILGAIILSFLPFVRSEGLIIIGVFVFYLLIKKQWKFIPLFTIGHLVYSIIGYFHYHDILWVFNKIPYAKLSSTYGNGELFHFVHQLFYVIGAPIYVLLIFGILKIVSSYFLEKKSFFSTTSILIFGGFLAFLIAHSLFWYLGIFNSMGLKRVLISVAPLIALIALNGFNLITEQFVLNNKILKLSIKFVLIGSILFFPFSGNKAAINWKNDFSLSASQNLANKSVSYLNTIKTPNTTFIFSNPYLSEQLNINYFDETIRRSLSNENLERIKPSDIIIWDSWFGVIENGISEEKIRTSFNLKEIKTFKIMVGSREVTYILFKKK